MLSLTASFTANLQAYLGINILSGTLGTHTAVALEEHALIIKFLEEGNREFARTAVSEHVRNVSSRIIEDEDNKEETN